MEKEEFTIRTVLKNEFTWLGGVIIACWMVVVNIIIPINSIQIAITQIQMNQQDTTKFQTKQLLVNDAFNSRLSVLESEIKK